MAHGPCGYAAILRTIHPSTGEIVEREVVGSMPEGTNQRAEMMAVLSGLRALTRPSRVLVLSDSEYVVNGFAKGWIHRWEGNGWRNRENKPVANLDLWKQLAYARRPHSVEFQHIKGHARSYVCECGWSAAKRKGDPRRVACPDCREMTGKLAQTFPLNERADHLAGEARRALIESRLAA